MRKRAELFAVSLHMEKVGGVICPKVVSSQIHKLFFTNK